MTPEKWHQIEELYLLARERGEAVLANSDPDVRRSVERMLAQDGEGKILDQPAVDVLPEPENVKVGSLIGPYRIGGILGAGGMGEVYWAQDTNLKRRVALKVLPNAFARDPERLARFQREAELLAQLDHPGIARIYGAEENALVMELVEGESPKGPLPFEEAWNVAFQITEALEYAHDRGANTLDFEGHLKKHCNLDLPYLGCERAPCNRRIRSAACAVSAERSASADRKASAIKCFRASRTYPGAPCRSSLGAELNGAQMVLIRVEKPLKKSAMGAARARQDAGLG